MKYMIVILSVIGIFVGNSVVADDPITFDNDSVKQLGKDSLIPIDRSSRSTSKEKTQVLEDVPQPPAQPVAQSTQGKTSPRFSVININGPKAPRAHVGKQIKRGPKTENGSSIRVVEFWATWCGPCTRTIPVLSKAQEIYGKKNVVVIGYSSEEDEKLVRAYVKEKGSAMNYTVRHDPQRRTSDPYSAIWKVGTIPHAYVVSHQGRILWHGNPGNVQTFERAIVEAIQYRDGQ